jgi:predicted O-methyltransferase YrrM
MKKWLRRLFASEGMLKMGHHQRLEDLNLGLGWVYYALARVIRPSCVVVIGSWRGFVPLVMARALKDNVEKGKVIFIDPSLADDFWSDPKAVKEHFRSFGIRNVRHFRMTTEEFVQTAAYRALRDVGLLFVDGYHTMEQARTDHEAFRPLMSADGVVLFHDSAGPLESRMYGPDKLYTHSVHRYMDELRRDGRFQVFDLPQARGVTLVREAAAVQPDSPDGETAGP